MSFTLTIEPGDQLPAIKQWFEDIWKYAQTKPVPPEQFQYGIKPFPGTKNIAQKKLDGAGKFQEWTVAGNTAFDGYINDPAELRARAREMRDRKTGIILFGLHTASDVARINFVLNTTTGAPTANDAAGDYPDFDPAKPSNNTAKPSALTVPRQFPHTKESIDRLTKF